MIKCNIFSKTKHWSRHVKKINNTINQLLFHKKDLKFINTIKYNKIIENFDNLNNSGFVNIKCTPNGNIHKKLARLCFEELGVFTIVI